MKLVAIVCLVLLVNTIAFGLVYVREYVRDNGTYVESHYRTNPDGYKWNNWIEND